MKKFRIIALAAFAAPLTLGLSACGNSSDSGEAATAEPIAPIAPPAGKAWTDIVAVSKDGGYVMGNPDAPIKLVEYGSLTCPACANFAATGAATLKDKYVTTGRVSFEFRSMILHGPADLTLSRLISCGPPEAAHPRSDQIWANLNVLLDPLQTKTAALEQALQLPEEQRFVAFAEQAGFLDFFASRGLSKDEARQCLADVPSVKALVEKSQETSTRDKVTATPTFFLNGRRVESGAGGPWETIEPMLKQAGAR